MSEQWQVDIAKSESDRKQGRVEVAAYTSIGFDRRTVAVVDRLEDARQIVADHKRAQAPAPGDEATRAAEIATLRAALERIEDILSRETLRGDHVIDDAYGVAFAALTRPAAGAAGAASRGEEDEGR